MCCEQIMQIDTHYVLISIPEIKYKYMWNSINTVQKFSR